MEGRRSNRKQIAILAAPIVLLTALSPVADALTTSWAETHPMALMMLNSRNRILILVTNQMDAVSYYVVGTIRLLLTDPLWFLIGWLSGDAALQWVARRDEGLGRIVRWMERNFTRAAWPFVIIAPNPIVSLLAGATRMNVGLFFSLNVVGTIGRLVLIREVGSAFQAPIDHVLRFFAHYRIPLLVLSICAVSFNVWHLRRSGGGEIGELRDLTESVADEPEPEI